jgi:hypothetical protein
MERDEIRLWTSECPTMEVRISLQLPRRLHHIEPSNIVELDSE